MELFYYFKNSNIYKFLFVFKSDTTPTTSIQPNDSNITELVNNDITNNNNHQ